MTQDAVAVAANAAVLLLSVGGLVIFVQSANRMLAPRSGQHTSWGQRCGLLAATALTLSSMLSIVLAATAFTMSAGTAAWLQYASFITGGVAHVVGLGLYVWLTGRALSAAASAFWHSSPRYPPRCR